MWHSSHGFSSQNIKNQHFSVDLKVCDTCHMGFKIKISKSAFFCDLKVCDTCHSQKFKISPCLERLKKTSYFKSKCHLWHIF